jgi:hypothetical protein
VARGRWVRERARARRDEGLAPDRRRRARVGSQARACRGPPKVDPLGSR